MLAGFYYDVTRSVLGHSALRSLGTTERHGEHFGAAAAAGRAQATRGGVALAPGSFATSTVFGGLGFERPRRASFSALQPPSIAWPTTRSEGFVASLEWACPKWVQKPDQSATKYDEA